MRPSNTPLHHRPNLGVPRIIAPLLLGCIVSPLHAAILASSGFNDQSGLNSNPTVNSPFQIGITVDGQGAAEPGWEGAWQKLGGFSDRGPVSTDFVFEGDASVKLFADNVFGTSIERQWSNIVPQVRIDTYVLVRPGAQMRGNASFTTTGGEIPQRTVAYWDIASSGNIQVLQASTNQTLTTGFVVLPNTWNKYSLILDVPSQSWQFLFNDQLFQTAQPLKFLIPSSFVDRVSLQAEGVLTTYVDNVIISGNPRILTWTGQADGSTWNSSVANWKYAPVASTAFANGDSVVFDDSASPTATTIHLNIAVSPTNLTINSSSNNYSISGSGSINNLAILSKAGSSTLTLAVPLNYSGSTTIDGGLVRFTASSNSIGKVSGIGSLEVASGASLVSGPITLSSLLINGSHTIQPAGTSSTASILTFLSIAKTAGAFTGKLDLTSTSMILQTTTASDKTSKIATLVEEIASGSNASHWNGNGLTSSVAAANPTHYGISVLDNDNLHLFFVGGLPVDQNSLIVTLTHLGDANANGVIDIQDQALITNHWQSPQQTWSSGDLNFDGFVDIQDLTLVTNNWQQQSTFSLTPESSVLSPQSSSLSSIPEPTSLLLLAPTLLLFRRRLTSPSR